MTSNELINVLKTQCKDSIQQASVNVTPLPDDCSLIFDVKGITSYCYLLTNTVLLVHKWLWGIQGAEPNEHPRLPPVWSIN